MTHRIRLALLIGAALGSPLAVAEAPLVEPPLVEAPLVEAPAAADAATLQQPEVIAGIVLEKSPDRLVIRDEQGSELGLRITEYTRFIWGERSSISDFQVGARIKASYELLSEIPRALEVWIVEPPAGGMHSAR